MKMKVVAFKFLAKIARNVACLSAFFALSASAETVAKVGETEYESLEAAIQAAEDGATISLAEGGYSTYGKVSNCKKRLTFVGAGAGKTIWTIGDLSKNVAGEANGDYSFDGSPEITFKEMTLKTDNANYRGFIRIAKTAVENCTLEGRTAYWGTEEASFVNSTFNAPEGDYALWDYSSKEMTFNGCQFNTSGKAVNVYRDAPLAEAIGITLKGCTINSTRDNRAVLNIKNSNQAVSVTLAGENKVLIGGVEAADRLYQVENAAPTATNGKSVTVVAVKADGTTEVIFEVKPIATGVTVSGIAGFEGKSFESFAAAYEAIKPIVEKLGLGQEGATAEQFDALFTAVDANGDATITYTISGNVVYDETNCENLLSMGRKASHYDNGRHLINFKFVGKTGKGVDTLTVNSGLTLPYEWWSEKKTTGIHFENLTLTGSAPNGLYAYQSYFEGIDFSVANCILKGLKIYNCSNVSGSYSITDSVLDGTGASADSYAIHLQGNETAPLAITIKGNTITGYDRGVNIDQKTAVATISENTISVNDVGRSCIQLTQLAETTVSGNTLNLAGGNAITLHEQLLGLVAAPKISVTGNTVEGNGYLVYDDAAANDKAFTSDNLVLTYGTDNTVAETVDTTKGVKGSKVVSTSVAVNNVIQHYVATVGETGYCSLADALAVAKDGDTVKMLADVTVAEPVVIEKAITLDLDGKTVTSTWAMPSGASGDGRYAFLVRADATVCNGTLAAGQARALGAYASLTLTKATVTSALTGGHCCVAFCADGGHYTVTDATISGDYAIANFANNATVVIANSVLEGSGCGLYHNGQNFGLKMTVTDSTVNGAIDSSTIAEGRDPSGVYVSGSETVIGNEKNQNGVGKYHQVTFVRCTIKGNTGVEVKYTDLCLEDCTVVATTQTPSYKGNNDGMATLGFAVVATDNSKGTTPKPAGSITITGEKGSYTGLVGLGALASVKETFADFEDTATIAISGGRFSTAVPPQYCAAGFIPTANDNGTYGVKEGAYVAAIGEVKYETLAEAIAAAKASKTVMLIADTRENVIIDKRLTLDLNGFTLNGGTVKGKAALTVNGVGVRVTIKDSSEAQTGTIKREDTAENSGVTSYYVLDIQGDGFVSFEGGTVVNNSGTTDGTRKGASLVRIGDDSVSARPQLTIRGGTFRQNNFVAIKVDRGTFFLTGGTINCPNDEAVKNWGTATIKGGTVNGTVASWVYADSKASSSLTISDDATVNGNVYAMSYDGAEGKTATVSITGGYVTGELGTYQGKNIHDKTALSDAEKASIGVTGGRFTKDPSAYLAEGSTVIKGEDGTFSVQRAPLAQIGDKYYYTMDEAFHAANASEKVETIVLLRDYTTPELQNSGSKGFTLDLNGKTWTCTGSDANSAAFEINYSDVTLTVKNGKIVSNQLLGLIPSAMGMGGKITTYDNAALVFEDVEATVNGRSGIETNGNNTNDAITLKGCTLTVANGYGIYFPSSGTLTIEDSVIVAKTMGVQVCAGSLNITGASKLTVTGDAVSKVENDGAIEDGAAVSVVSRTGYKGLEKIVLSGGTFIAKDGNAAFKAYAWANGVESAFDNTTATIAISGGTFSTAVLPQYCAAGYEPVKNADNTYGVKATFTIATVKKSAASDETIDIRVPYVLLEKVAGETQAEKVENLSKQDTNGNLAWVNLVAGIDPEKKVTMTAPQNDKPDVIDVNLPAVGTAPEGTDVTVRYEIRADDSDAAVISAEAAEDLVINLNGKAGIGTYRAYVCLRQNGSEVARVESANALGVLQTVRAANKTIIAVPWLSLTDGNAIAVADLVKTAGLAEGDKLHVYNKTEDRYDVYELTADKAWAPKAIYKVGADGTVATASSGTPETTTVARGSGVWLERKDTTQPIVSYGAFTSAKVATTLDAGTKEKPTWHLLAVPTTTAVNLATTFGTSEADEIIVPTDGGSPKIYTVEKGVWGYEKTVSVKDKFGNVAGVKSVHEPEAELPAGTGFWYLNGGDAKTVNW